MIWLLLAFGFAFGSIPFGYLIGKAKGVDIRTEGSGNIGATNVYRVLGKGPAVAVFVLDVAKGLIPALLAQKLLQTQESAFACGAAAVVGHSFSPFLKFKGGKGIATGLGMLLGATPLVALSAFGVFFLGLSATLIVSIASICSGLGALSAGILYKDPTVLIYAYAALAVYIIMRHRPNIGRLKAGTEPKFAHDPKNEMRFRILFAVIGIVLIATAIASHVSK